MIPGTAPVSERILGTACFTRLDQRKRAITDNIKTGMKSANWDADVPEIRLGKPRVRFSESITEKKAALRRGDRWETKR